VSADADANEALSRMQQARTGRLMVTDGERLVGILVLKDLLRFLALRAERERDWGCGRIASERKHPGCY
jgi:CBS domain-containing protein